MVEVTLRYDETQFEKSGFQCAEPGCTRRYTSGRGYFDVINGSVLAEKFQQSCPKCKTPMYLSEVEQDGEIWRCPNPPICVFEQKMVG
jgi:hypothetical protein